MTFYFIYFQCLALLATFILRWDIPILNKCIQIVIYPIVICLLVVSTERLDNYFTYINTCESMNSVGALVHFCKPYLNYFKSLCCKPLPLSASFIKVFFSQRTLAIESLDFILQYFPSLSFNVWSCLFEDLILKLRPEQPSILWLLETCKLKLGISFPALRLTVVNYKVQFQVKLLITEAACFSDLFWFSESPTILIHQDKWYYLKLFSLPLSVCSLYLSVSFITGLFCLLYQ